MLDQDLKKLWQELSGQEVVIIESKELVGDLKARVNSMEAAIEKRDRTEIQAAGLVIVIFSLAGYFVPWNLSKVGAFLLIPFALLVIWMLKSVKKYKTVDFSQPLNQYIQNYLEYLKKERQLLRNILYWYILPGVIPAILFVIGFGSGSVSKLLTVIFILVVNGYVYRLNQRTVRKLFNPLIQDMEQMVEKLKNEQEEERKEI
jgi:hypothetical protein